MSSAYFTSLLGMGNVGATAAAGSFQQTQGVPASEFDEEERRKRAARAEALARAVAEDERVRTESTRAMTRAINPHSSAAPEIVALTDQNNVRPRPMSPSGGAGGGTGMPSMAGVISGASTTGQQAAPPMRPGDGSRAQPFNNANLDAYAAEREGRWGTGRTVLPKIRQAAPEELEGLRSGAFDPELELAAAREMLGQRYGAGDTPPGMSTLKGSERLSVTPGMAWADMGPAAEYAAFQASMDQRETGKVEQEARRAAAERSIEDPYEAMRVKAEFDAFVREREQGARGDADTRSRTAEAEAKGRAQIGTDEAKRRGNLGEATKIEAALSRRLAAIEAMLIPKEDKDDLAAQALDKAQRLRDSIDGRVAAPAGGM